MKYDGTTVAHSVTVSDANLINLLGAGVTRIDASGLPWREPNLAAVVRFELEEADFEQSHVIGLSMVSPEGRTLGQMNLDLTPDLLRKHEEQVAEGEVRHLHIIGDFDNARFPTAGRHHLISTIDGVEVGDYPLVVVDHGGDPSDDRQTE